MDTSRRIKMNIEVDVTIPQALALQAMFEYMNQLSGCGSSRYVGFMADGDGNFHPKPKFEFSEKIPELTSEMKEKAVFDCIEHAIHFGEGDKMIDFDPIAWMLTDVPELKNE